MPPNLWGGIGSESGTDTLFVNWRGSNNHMLTSTDGGATWLWYNWSKPSEVAITDENWRSVGWVRQNSYSYIDDPHTPGTIYRSDVFNLWRIEVNAPGSVNLISDSAGIENTEPLALVASPSEDALVHVGTQDISGFTFKDRSTDAETRFSQLADVNQNTTSVAVSYGNPDHVLVGGELGKLAYSTDGGETFTGATRPANNAHRTMVAVDAVDPTQFYFIGTSNTLKYSHDAGVSWTDATGLPGNIWKPGSKFGNAQIVAADTVTADRAYLYVAGGSSNSGSGGRLFRTDNAGVTWTEAGQLASRKAKFGVQVKTAPGAAGDVWVGLEGQGLWRSTNAGASMQEIAGFNNVITFGFGRAAPGETAPAIYVYGDRGGAWGVWQSTDDAATWTQIDDARWPALARLTQIEGDINDYGQIYLGLGGLGTAWLDIDPDEPTPTPGGGVLLDDGFDGLSGWTVNTGSGASVTANGSGQVLIEKVSGSGVRTATLSQDIALSGEDAIRVRLTAFQAGTTANQDFIEIGYTLNGVSTTLLKDADRWDAIDNPGGGSTAVTTAPLTTDWLDIDVAPSDSVITIWIKGGARTADILLDRFEVESTPTPGGGVLLDDGFDGLPGWTVNTGSGASVTANGSGQVLIEKVSGSGVRTATLSRNLSISNLDRLQVRLTAFQAGTTANQDFIEIGYTLNGVSTTLLKDADRWDAIDNPGGGSTAVTTAPLTTDWLDIDVAPSDSVITIWIKGGARTADILLDRLEVFGVA